MRTHHVIAHSVEDARLALRAAAQQGDRVVLLSAEGAALYAGAAWFRELQSLLAAEFPGVLVDAILDCGAAPGAALGALRCGVKTISLRQRRMSVQRSRRSPANSARGSSPGRASQR